MYTRKCQPAYPLKPLWHTPLSSQGVIKQSPALSTCPISCFGPQKIRFHPILPGLTTPPLPPVPSSPTVPAHDLGLCLLGGKPPPPPGAFQGDRQPCPPLLSATPHPKIPSLTVPPRAPCPRCALRLQAEETPHLRRRAVVGSWPPRVQQTACPTNTCTERLVPRTLRVRTVLFGDSIVRWTQGVGTPVRDTWRTGVSEVIWDSCQ